MAYEEQMLRIAGKMAEGQPVNLRQEDLAELRPMWEGLSDEEQRDVTGATEDQLDAICNGESNQNGDRMFYSSWNGDAAIASTTIATHEFLDELFGYLGVKP